MHASDRYQALANLSNWCDEFGISCVFSSLKFIRNIIIVPLLLAVLFVSIFIGISQKSAMADVAFTGTSAGGTWTLGDSFGTWTAANSLTNNATVSDFTINSNGLNYRFFNLQGEIWDLQSDFVFTPDPASNPDMLFRSLVRGRINPLDSFGSAFSFYDLSFSSSSGGAVFVDPDNLLFNKNIADSSWNQRDFQDTSLPASCESGLAALRNECLSWEVLSPTFGGGVSTMTLNAEGGRAVEGFAFSLASIANLEVAKSVSSTNIHFLDDPATPAITENAGHYDITLTASIVGGAFSNATSVEVIDTLPAGLTLDTSQGGGDGWEIVTSTGGAGTQQLTTADTTSYNPATGVWSAETVAIGGTVTLRIYFVVDGDQGGNTIVNSIDASSVSMDQSDPDGLSMPITASFTVQSEIVPDDDNGTGTSGTASTPITNVTATDTVNDFPVDLTPGTGNATVTEDGIWPAGFNLNADGSVDMADTVPAGAYTMDYELCDTIGPNCETATITVTVGSTPIDAVAETFPPVNGVDGGVTTSVLASDTLNGNPVDPADVTITVGTSDPELALDPNTGLITVAPNTAAGTYEVTYTVCEDVNPANCSTVTESVTVGAAAIDAVAETFPPVNGVDGGVTTSVLASDTLNGNPVDPADVTITVGTSDPELALDPNTGLITVAPNTAAGTYEVTYTVCEDVNPANCSTVTESVTVGATAIDAVDDAPAAVNGDVGETIPNVVTNDTLNGVANPVIGTNVTVNESGTAEDGTTMLGLDMAPASGSITLDPATGEVTVAAGTTAGTYVYTYEICEVLNPTNCDTAEVTVVVNEAPPVATNDTLVATDPGPVTVDPLLNDEGGVPLVPSTFAFTGTGMPSGVTPSPDGKTLSVPGEGVWTFDPTTGLVTFTPEAGFSGAPTSAAYEVSDVLGRTTNEALLSAMVLPALEIIAVDNGPLALNGASGATSDISVLSNDTIDGVAITDPATVNFTPVLVPTPTAGSISINDDGTVTVAAGTTPGTYTLEYEICEVANPTNCDTALVEIVVLESDSLISEVKEDLTNILEEDLANTVATQSGQISNYSANALGNLRRRSHGSCLVDVNALLSKENILFDTDKSIIKPASNRTLDEVADILNSCSGSSFEIAGHTDSDASEAYNLDLSQRRVIAVQNALAARGVDTSSYVARGYGESEPIASNATQEGKARNRRVEFRPLDATAKDDGFCNDNPILRRTFNANGDDEGVNADGTYLRDRHDCITDQREVIEGSFTYIDTETGQTHSSGNLSYRIEQYSESKSVRGFFLGAYGSQSDVSKLAAGEVNGFGANAGIYGATRLDDNDLFLNYYLGGAFGQHEFDLDFARNVGVINANGDYQYFAGFAGAAVSGSVEVGEATLMPRIGFDYVYTPGADVDVIANLGGLSEVGTLELDAISGGRVFSEVRADQEVFEDAANLWFNPRIACYQNLGSLDGVCGFGGSLGLESKADDNDLTYAIEIDGEWGESYTRGSISLSAQRQTNFGVLSGDLNLDSEGNAKVESTFKVNF